MRTDTALDEDKEVEEVVSDYKEISEEKFMWETIEEFENKCMDIIEQIVSIDVKQTRLEAIEISEKMRDKAVATKDQKVVEVYERVVKEFEIATDEEYELLRKQIFNEN